MRPRLLVALAVFASAGCGSGSYKISTVSGRVTLDGKPLAKASVTFVPMATQGNDSPGPTAQGKTDADGRYTLAVDPGRPGAVVGKCRIYITTIVPEAMGKTDPDRDAGGTPKFVRDRVPEKYNLRTELTFDVPPEGTDKANFDLTSK